MNSDPVIDEVRSVRRKISASYGHDVRKMITDHIKQQERYANRLIKPGHGRRRSSPRAAEPLAVAA